ncbi:receptor-like serine/threonine-protein kinase At2g45590 [Camellia sinensis]|uniref:receptor-like serine/threonine-protein kinase At2g45590 n=1 Tax=Camellia sinensis TaxID=4442 RepID=UPI00103576DD|nr:receptor-like serine/threonine-protein kinase At2g45590 [Camellia sinensis]
MPSRQFPPQLPPPPPHHSLLLPISGSISAAFSILLLLTFCFRKLTKKRTVVSDSKPPHRFSYSALRRSTSSFSPSRLLGHGGSGSVYRGTLKNPSKDLAVKVMDVGSLQGEREYQNELSFAGKLDSDYIVSAIGFSSDQKRRRMVLVYELMNNGSLQDCLFHRKCSELMEWKKRFEIAIEIAKGLEYLHHDCDPAVIHGDVKPSNILLDLNFNAKIGDFGLARLKSEDQCEIAVANGGLDGRDEDNGSIGFDESNSGPNQSPESFVRLSVSEKSPEMVLGVKSSPPETVEKSLSRKDWWWKQDNGSRAESGVVKDYVMEWIGNEIKKERPKSEWIGASSSSGQNGKKSERKKSRKRLDWWTTMDDDKNVKKKEKRRPAREWWKEEYCEELEKKKKKKQKHEQGSINDANNSENWWPMEEELNADRKKKKKRSRNSSPRSSVDWWLDGLSAELGRARRNSHGSASGEMAKSGGCSSTPSTRGTVCYIAPEYGCGGEISEKCDVYSFGVLLLVLVSGRRPLQVTGSPISEFKRANLLSWARNLARAGKLLDLVDQSIQILDKRNLARAGKLLDLVDQSIQILDKKQALLCLTVAMLCIQKLPARRPSMKEVVGMLSGELDSPQLPVEFSPSPPSQVPFKSNKKGPVSF